MGKVKYIPGVQKEQWHWEALLLMPVWLFCIRAAEEWEEVNGVGHAEKWRCWMLSVHAISGEIT